MDLLLFLAIVGVGLAVRRAMVRLNQADRANELLRERITNLEKALASAPLDAVPATREIPRVPPVISPAPPPAPIEPALPVLPTVPPEGGSYTVGSDEAGPEPNVRSFRLQAEQSPVAQHEYASESLETQIGSRWLLYIGIVLMVIGVAYFEKLAIDKQWIGETARVIQGAVFGLALVYGGLRFVRAGYDAYGQMIAGGGAAILYLSTYAAFNYYHLIGQSTAFIIMVGITGMVAWLADHLESQGLALFAVGGGFGTPFLLPGTTDAQVALFGYDAILIAGTMALSHRRNWPALNIVSYVFTLVTVAFWADAFYTAQKYLRTELFITLFCAMFLYVLRQTRRVTSPAALAATMVLWTAPAAYYLASWVILMDHGTAMLVWLVAVMLVGGILSERFGTGPGFAVWIAVTVPLLLWTVVYTAPSWRNPGLTTVAAVYLIALTAQLRQTFSSPDGPREMGVADVAWLHLNGLLMFAAAHFLITTRNLDVTATVAFGFALWQGGLAALLWNVRRDQALHFTALGFTLLSIAIALEFDGAPVTIGWAVEGAAVIALGLRERKDWMRLAGTGLFVTALELAVTMLAATRSIDEAVLLNARAATAATIIALSYAIAWLHYRDRDAPDRALALAASLLVAQFVTLALLTSEIHGYWARHEGHFARELMVSVTWGAYATALIVIGLQKRYAPIRYFAIVVFGITIAKVFAFDMADLERIYRVGSTIILGVLLLLTSYLYTRSKPR
jgi:uncharacterized membrane protein